MASFNWTCPYCSVKTTVNSDKYRKSVDQLTLNSADGYKKLDTHWIVCPNDECRKISLILELYDVIYDNDLRSYFTKDLVKIWNLLPNSHAKTFPSYIPKVIIEDYEEACSIIDLSPKASATLSRRCLQGIIRDYWGIKKGRLIDEINALEDKIDPITWESINAVRKVGNIGAHMEKDINLIIEVESEEANLLIQLIELLLTEWYIHRHEREKKLKLITNIALEKDQQKVNFKKSKA